jgi:hypothetical protein
MRAKYSWKEIVGREFHKFVFRSSKPETAALLDALVANGTVGRVFMKHTMVYKKRTNPNGVIYNDPLHSSALLVESDEDALMLKLKFTAKNYRGKKDWSSVPRPMGAQ